MKVGVVVAGLSLLGALPAMAQTPRAEVNVGYTYMQEQDRDENYPAGFVVDVAGNINNWSAGVAEVGMHFRTCENCQRGPFDSNSFRGRDLNLRIFSYLAGPRFVARPSAAVSPFFQVLLGGTHASSVQWDGALSTGFTYQPGAGVSISVSPTLGVRLQGDYRVIRTSGVDNHHTRIVVGVVYRKGDL